MDFNYYFFESICMAKHWGDYSIRAYQSLADLRCIEAGLSSTIMHTKN